MSAPLLYALAGTGLFGLGLYGLLAHRHVLRRVMALNVAGAGVFMILVALGRAGARTDVVPDALVLTGIVITVAATAVTLGLGRRLARPEREPGHEPGAGAGE